MLHLIPNNQKQLRQLKAELWNCEDYLVVSTEQDSRVTIMGFKQWLTERTRPRTPAK